MLDAGKKMSLFGQEMSLRDFFLVSGAYSPGMYRRWYAAFFTSFNKFFVQDLTWSVNGIMNINDLSAIISTGWSWAAVYNFTAGLSFNVFLGEKDTEYGMSGNLLSTDLSLSINF